MQFTNIKLDSEGIISFESQGKICHNPFLIALQALVGNIVMDDYPPNVEYLVPRYYSLEDLDNPVFCKSCIKAMEWIKSHYVEVGDAILWNYDYDGEYEGNILKAPWHSSYGQSYVILSLVQWFFYTKEEEYERLLEKAIKGLVLPIEEGGCLNYDKNGIWFEEIIGENITHIFNAHLISLIALIKVKEYTTFTWVEEYIEKGLNCFYSYANQMDTGINSAYDRKKRYDCFWQIVPEDSGRNIFIKEVSIIDDEKEHSLDLSKPSCFEMGEQWIAGIDWTETDEEGYRGLLYGKSIHPIAPSGGERQNTYIYFTNIRCEKDYFTLKINYKVLEDTKLFIFKNCSEIGYYPLGYVNGIYLPKNSHMVEVKIPFCAIATHVSEVYHRYHIQLLEELNNLIPSFKVSYLIDKFRKYEDTFKEIKKMKLYSGGGTYPKLASLSISVNEQCGLYCKMCDLGIKNKESSMYRFMKNDHFQKELDAEVLLKRCKELKEKLEVVQFIGTEPTLYKKLPEVIKEMVSMGIRVTVTTNGINLKNMLIPLLDAGLMELYISIDGPSEVHNNIRGKERLFQDIMGVLEENKEAIKRAKEKGFQLGIGVAITPMNYEHLTRLVEEIKGTPIQSIWCTHMNYISPHIAEKHSICILIIPLELPVLMKK